jgi:hypothetical protein
MIKLARHNYVNEQGVLRLCLDCMDTLDKDYPHYQWSVEPSVDYSMLYITLVDPITSGYWGVKLRTQDVDFFTTRRKLLMRHGGDLLEKFNKARHKYTSSTDVKLKRNTRGEIIPES